MKRGFSLALAVLLVLGIITGCGGISKDSISVISREEGSGTRGAFTELFGIEEKDESGEEVDYTTDEATVTNSTQVMMTSVAGDPNAIGYISLGSLNDTVMAAKIDGIEATSENVMNGAYKIARPFNIITKGEVSELAADFISYILSSEGQQIIIDNGYTAIGDMPAFTSAMPSGSLTISGSSSVSPVMEKLVEAYQKVNTGASIEIQESDSTTGVTDTVSGNCDIGMTSRELKDSEIAEGLESTVIAMDGIAVILNKENTVAKLSSEEVKAIFKGEITRWSELGK